MCIFANSYQIGIPVFFNTIIIGLANTLILDLSTTVISKNHVQQFKEEITTLCIIKNTKVTTLNISQLTTTM